MAATQPNAQDGGPKIVTNAQALATIREHFATFVASLNDTKVIEDLATAGCAIIRKRTFGGDGADAAQSPFRGYSARWAIVRRALGLPTNRVTLSLSGTMLDSVSFRVDGPRQATIYVAPRYAPGGGATADIIAHGHQNGVAKSKLPRRLWFGFSDAQRRQLEKERMRLLVKEMVRIIPELVPDGVELKMLSEPSLLSKTGKLDEPRASREAAKAVKVTEAGKAQGAADKEKHVKARKRAAKKAAKKAKLGSDARAVARGERGTPSKPRKRRAKKAKP